MNVATEIRPAIIGKYFRDIGQPDDGLTPAVEEVLGATMRRLARNEGHKETDFAPATEFSKEYLYRPTALTDKLRAILEFLAAHSPAFTIEVANATGRDDEATRRLLIRLQQRGATENIQPGIGQRAEWCITRVGRRSLVTGELPPITAEAAAKVARK